MGERATRRRFTREFKLEAVRQDVGEGPTQKAVAAEGIELHHVACCAPVE